jgi:hypothetical protein
LFFRKITNSICVSSRFQNGRPSADQNELNPYQKVDPTGYRFETYQSSILSIGSFHTMCGLLGLSPLHSVAGTVNCDPIVWLSCGDVRENENVIEDPRARKHRSADHCILNIHDHRGDLSFGNLLSQ